MKAVVDALVPPGAAGLSWQEFLEKFPSIWKRRNELVTGSDFDALFEYFDRGKCGVLSVSQCVELFQYCYR